MNQRELDFAKRDSWRQEIETKRKQNYEKARAIRRRNRRLTHFAQHLHTVARKMIAAGTIR